MSGASLDFSRYCYLWALAYLTGFGCLPQRYNWPTWAELTSADAAVLLLWGASHSNNLLLLWPWLNWFPVISCWKTVLGLGLFCTTGSSLPKPTDTPQRGAAPQTPPWALAESCSSGSVKGWLHPGLQHISPGPSCWLPAWAHSDASAIGPASTDIVGLGWCCDWDDLLIGLVSFPFKSLESVRLEWHFGTKDQELIHRQHGCPHWNVWSGWKWEVDNQGKSWYPKRASRVFYTYIFLS